MHWKPLALEDGPLIREYLRKSQTAYSQYNFTTLYLWQRMTEAKWKIVENCLCIVMNVGDCAFAMFPVGEGNVCGAVEVLRQEFSQCLSFGLLTEDMAASMEQWYPGKVTVVDRRDSYDYVYARDKLVTLSGKKLHGKRNHINKFKSLYEYEYHPFAPQWARECLKLEEAWLESKTELSDFFRECEYDAVRRSIEDFGALECRGGILTVKGKVIAFSIGEMLTEDTALIHMEKANPAYQGAYAMINQQFCQHEFAQATYIDREEDMGLEGLRKAKLSYAPDHLVAVKSVIIGS